MSDQMRLDIQGMEQVKSILGALPSRMRSGVVDSAMRKASTPIKDKAKALSPIYTGNLKKSIGIVRTKKKRWGKKYLIVTRTDGSNTGKGHHATMVSNLIAGKGKSSHFQNYMFMRKTFNARKNVSVRVLQVALATYLNRATSKLR